MMSAKALLLLSCITLAVAAGESPMKITSESNGKTIEVAVGSRFDLTLPENITIGYSWAVKGELSKLVQLVGEPEHKENKGAPGSKRLGSGGMVTFHFKAVGKGKAEITFVYRRPWEKDRPPAKSFKLKVEITG